MDEHVRDLLTDALPQHEPPMPPLDLAAGRRARRRDLGMRTVGLVAVVGLLATAVVLVTGSARSPDRPTQVASTAAETPDQVLARLDRVWRAAIPGGAALAQARADYGTDARGRYFDGFYHLTAGSKVQVNYVVSRRFGPPDQIELDPCLSHRPTIAACTRAQQPDGSTVITYRQYFADEHLVMLSAVHFRPGGVVVYASVFVPGTRLAGATFPLSAGQLVAAATNPGMTFAANVRVPKTKPTPAPTHNPPPSDTPVPDAAFPTLPAQHPCRNGTLPDASVRALGDVLAARLQAIVGEPGRSDGGTAVQNCVTRGTLRAALAGVSAGRVSVNAEVTLTSYAQQVPSPQDPGCPAGARMCELFTAAGHHAVRYEVDTGAANNMHVVVYYGSHVTVDVVLVAEGNTTHTYALNRAELISLATAHKLIEVVTKLAQ